MVAHLDEECGCTSKVTDFCKECVEAGCLDLPCRNPCLITGSLFLYHDAGYLAELIHNVYEFVDETVTH